MTITIILNPSFPRSYLQEIPYPRNATEVNLIGFVRGSQKMTFVCWAELC